MSDRPNKFYDDGYDAAKQILTSQADVESHLGLEYASHLLEAEDFAHYHKGFHEGEIDFCLDEMRNGLRIIAERRCSYLGRLLVALTYTIDVVMPEGEDDE